MTRSNFNFPIYFAIFIVYIGYSFIISALTILFYSGDTAFFSPSTSIEMREVFLGVAIFLYPFGRFLSSPILGALSDYFGRRPILILSLLCTTLVFALLGYAVKINSLWLILITLLLGGLTEATLTIAQGIVADISSGPTRSRLFGYLYLSMALSYIVGPVFGGVIAGTRVFSDFSFHIPFYIVSVLLGVTCVWLIVRFKETLKTVKREKIRYFEAFTNLKNLFLWRHLRFIFLVNGFIYLGIYGFFQGFPLFIETQFDVNVERLGLFIAWVSVPFLFVNSWLTEWLAKKYSSNKITAASALLICILLAVMLAFPQQNALWFTLFLVGFAIAICLPASTALLSSFAGEQEQGKALGINQSLQFFSESLAGLLVGIFAVVYIHLTLLAFGIFSLIGAFILWKKIARRN